MKVSVSILKEKENYLDVIEKLNNSKADYIHIDVLDNTFIKTSSSARTGFGTSSHLKLLSSFTSIAFILIPPFYFHCPIAIVFTHIL